MKFWFTRQLSSALPAASYRAILDAGVTGSTRPKRRRRLGFGWPKLESAGRPVERFAARRESRAPAVHPRNASPKQRTTDEWRQAVSPGRQANLQALFCMFYEARSPGPRKTSAFCESAMSAVSANCGASFLLAYLNNASAILEAADDLRGAIAKRSLGSRRGAARGCVPTRNVGTSRLNCQNGGRPFLPDGTRGRNSVHHGAVGLGSLTSCNLAGRAATFCRVAARILARVGEA